ncbi:MAG: YkgJ family cysteine cluster protein [Eubacteriales bacterium]|nr:YkgJ family cysteine cluster protein [Eubacteriales bacterium]
MLRDVDMSEISDGRLYGAQDLVKVGCRDCEGCSACCSGMGESIVLDPFDVWQLGGHLGQDFGQLLESSLELHAQDGVILPNLKMAGERECCVYLNEKGRCSVHAFRPGLCRLFPLGRFYENGSFRYFLQTGECRRENRTKLKVKKWIDLPDFARYERFVADWHFFVRTLQERLAKRQDMEAARSVNLYVLQQFFFRGWEPAGDFYGEFAERLEEAKQYCEKI